MDSLIYNAVKNRLDEYFKFFENIVNIESYTPNKTDVDKVGAFIRKFVQANGFNVFVHPFEKSGDGFVVSMNEDAQLPHAVFTGHLDTVFPSGEWNKPFFKINGNIITGPGVFDMKGGLVIGLLAMQALKDIGFKDREVRFIFVPDEELSEGLSGESGKDFIRDNARGGAIAITLEGGCGSYITVGRKASIRYKVRVKGVAAHAGGHYADGRSAIKGAAQQILEIEKASDPDQITYNCGLIKGGISPNTVPGCCEYTLYNRYWRTEQRQVIIKRIENILSKPYIADTHTEFEIIGERLPMDDSPINYKLAEYLNNVAQDIGIERRSTYKEPSGSDASYTWEAGVPSVCSMGPVGFGAHQMNETVYADSIDRQAFWLAEAIYRLPESFPNN